MSDFARLKEMLRRSARDGTAQPGRVRYVTWSDGLAGILEQVDIAVVGQRLNFEFDDGSRLVCEASGRRLVRLLAPPPAGLTAEHMALFGRDELSVGDVHGLSILLRGLCERSAGFAATAEPLGEAAGPVRGGVDPGAIAEAAGLPGEAMPGTGEGTAQEALLEGLQPLLQAVVVVEGEEAALAQGEGDDAARLVDWVENALTKLLSPAFPLLGTLETNGILVFALPEGAGRHLMVSGRRGQLLVATIKGCDVAATVDLWRRSCQGNLVRGGGVPVDSVRS
ncbi:MAG: hypothetical protein H6897_02380 [Rhodobacteraceae bacterium]|jgi:hypothetical protein|uniref:hypothetical protein n=1 Tax=Albidovulum sp. TaxID=1872424 RepID=UPI001DE0F376|nr:hypothetical protein [Paracoccaceae bacterium]MCC0068758.1 hypothetical protein [Paracoccaceae bacterium]